MLRIDAPSTGYRDVVVSFATTRTSNEAVEQALDFSSDGGTTWVSVGEPYTIAMVDSEGYLARTVHLSEFDEVNDNPDLGFRILFTGEGASNADGNNRFDNLSVEGTSVFEVFDRIFVNGFEVPVPTAKDALAGSGAPGAVDGAASGRWHSGHASELNGHDSDDPQSAAHPQGRADENSACSPAEFAGRASNQPGGHRTGIRDLDGRGTQPAAVPVPVMSPATLVLMSLLLLIAGLSGLRAQAAPDEPSGRLHRPPRNGGVRLDPALGSARPPT